ncbi:MAG: hypothetical protein ABI718_05475 [Acidobacteriota bacterium]
MIEGDATTASMLAVIVRRSFPWDVVQVKTIPEGVTHLRSDDSFETVIADISLSSDGMAELTAETRRLKAGVVVLTTRPLSRTLLELFVGDDVFAVLPKPFELEELVTTLREAAEFAKTGSKMAARLFGFLKHSSE